MRLLATRGLGVPRGRIVVAMLIRTNLLIALWDSANDGELGRTVNPLPLGLVGSNPSTPTNLMNMLIGFLVFITLEIAIIATIGFTYFHEDDKNFKNYRKGKNS